VAAALAALLAGSLAWAWQQGRWPGANESGVGVAAGVAAGASATLALAGLTFLLLQRAGTPPGAGLSMLLGWAALWCVLLAPGRLRLAAAAAVLLLGVGLLAQLELGLGALESSWLRHFQKSTALLAIGIGAGVALQLQLRLRWRERLCSGAGQARVEWLLVMLAGVALCALAAQVLFGDETGVFDLQPVELAKLALAALTAHCLALGMGMGRTLSGLRAGPGGGPALDGALTLPEHSHPLWRWCRLGAPALLFAFLLALALLEVDDYSPLILLLVWSTSMAFAWALAARRPLAVAAVLALALLAAGAIVWLRLAGAGEVATWSFYADRFLVWLDPASHPHTGQQLLQGARAIAEGGWWGADGLAGLANLGQPVGAPLRIPQVQDDFAAAFFLNRHGLAAGLALWLLQALFLIGVLQTAARAHRTAAQARDFRQAWLGRFCCFALCGGAAFVLAHLLLSWGTNLAVFPIMGQPMSFLSAGGSHLLFFICPLLAFTAISAQTFEEIPSCRSMSNTKC
jgi:cell division protein FtsW